MTILADRGLEPIPDKGYQLTNQQQTELLAQLNDWRIDQSKPQLQLVRSFKFKNFEQALLFTNRIADLAEQVNHHPAILLEWGKVTVSWWTHIIGGLHINDFIMAARTDRQYIDQ